MVIISMVSFSENYLDVNKGIFFYAFFFSYFLMSTGKLRLVATRPVMAGNPVTTSSVLSNEMSL
jgi:hypothetical protein